MHVVYCNRRYFTYRWTDDSVFPAHFLFFSSSVRHRRRRPVCLLDLLRLQKQRKELSSTKFMYLEFIGFLALSLGVPSRLCTGPTWAHKASRINTNSKPFVMTNRVFFKGKNGIPFSLLCIFFFFNSVSLTYFTC